jgi:sec-independent protein translocase protein TatA
MRIEGLGGLEWVVIAVVLMLVFGTGKIASFGPALGKSIRGFREELKGEGEKPKETAQAPTAATAQSSTNKES